MKEKGEAIDKEIKELKKKYNDLLEKKQTVLETKINTAIAALKNDFRTVSTDDHRFFKEIIKSNKIISEEKYKSDTSAIPDETYSSVIKTNINISSNGKSYINTIYLSMNFQDQIWKILKEVDKDKLFEYISSSDYSWNTKNKKKSKRIFSWVVNLKLKLFNFDNKSIITSVSNERYVKEDIETY